ncbi:MAG: tRNA (adenosine(37)-N6)-dimethylallyltransferase MiaA [Victivallales bacterium]|nr:tRNA (adenosine(37)-N6)-dimethylallyltransferase MiaA [Victivallales bacterium]
MNDVRCVAILGPTCCWKSEIGLRLAEACGGEIVSCDSMQIYRGLPIGTAQPSAEDLARAPHHLIAELDIHEPYDANRFVQRAKYVLDDISARGKTAFLVGGTGLYARSLIYGFELLPADPTVFKALEAELAMEGGRERLMERLAAYGDAIPEDVRLNPRRLLRACEVLSLTGKPPWVQAKKFDKPDPSYKQYCLIPVLSMLKERIRRRTALMLKNGWLEEADWADRNGLLQTPTARQALGYAEVIDYLRHGIKGGLPALCEILTNRTVQYARRQVTWFKHQHPGAQLIEIEREEGAVEKILKIIHN